MQPKRAATFLAILTSYRILISIHAAQEGCDRNQWRTYYVGVIISIHAAQEGCDYNFFPKRTRLIWFQSTQPKRAATAGKMSENLPAIYFNPRSPRGLRLWWQTHIHHKILFQSTQPKRAATDKDYIDQTLTDISIHAAQEGCDFYAFYLKFNNLYYFNPRSPRGLRPKAI